MCPHVDATSNIRIVLSRLALTICWSPGIKRTEDTVWSCPENVFVLRHSFCTSHILIRRSEEQLTGMHASSEN